MNESSSSYMPRLDGLRAVAVGGVLLEHFCPSAAIRAVSPGGAGVTLFFVLSGYLISRILLQYRSKGTARGDAALHFYTRRFLRLSPPYYLAIAVAAAFGINGLNAKWWIPAFYLTNFHIALSGSWPGLADQFWSLAVEEQFYILWFIVVVVLPARFFIPSVACAMMTTAIFRLGVYSLSLNPLTTVLLLAQMASLSAGALIAYAEVTPGHARIERILRNRPLLILTGFAFAAVSMSLPFLRFPKVVLYPFIASAFFACLIRKAADPPRQAWLDWLSWAPLRHIGKISYGIFVYHMFIPETFIESIVGKSRWAVFGGLVVASIAVAELSWIAIERPVLKFKDRFTGMFLKRDRATITLTGSVVTEKA